MATSSFSIEIDTTPDRVFYWLDDAERIMKWVPNIVENEDLNVTENHVGSTFRHVYVEGGRRMEMEGVVTAYEPNRQLACDIHGDTFDLILDYRLEDLGDGRTRLTQETEVRFKGLMKLFGGIMMFFMKKSARKQHEESFATLKRLAETGE